MTSAAAAKLLRKLNEEHDALVRMERKTSTFVVSNLEKAEDVRPEYDYADVQSRLRTIEEQIRKIRHQINQFNLTQLVPEFDMTIDQMLVYIPQLTVRKNKLDHMKNRLPKERVQSGINRTAGIVEYEYSNYDIKLAEADYILAADELARAQNALDQINSTVEFEVDAEKICFPKSGASR